MLLQEIALRLGISNVVWLVFASIPIGASVYCSSTFNLPSPKDINVRSGVARTEVSWGQLAHLLLARQGHHHGSHSDLTRNLKLGIQALAGSDRATPGQGQCSRCDAVPAAEMTEMKSVFSGS